MSARRGVGNQRIRREFSDVARLLFLELMALGIGKPSGAQPSEESNPRGITLSLGAGVAGSLAVEAMKGFPYTELSPDNILIGSLRLAGRRGFGFAWEASRFAMKLTENVPPGLQAPGQTFDLGRIQSTLLDGLVVYQFRPDDVHSGAGALGLVLGVGAGYLMNDFREGRFLRDLESQYSAKAYGRIENAIAGLVTVGTEVSLARDVGIAVQFRMLFATAQLSFWTETGEIFPMTDLNESTASLTLVAWKRWPLRSAGGPSSVFVSPTNDVPVSAGVQQGNQDGRSFR